MNNLLALIPKFNNGFQLQIKVLSRSLEHFNNLKSIVAKHPHAASISQDENLFWLYKWDKEISQSNMRASLITLKKKTKSEVKLKQNN